MTSSCKKPGVAFWATVVVVVGLAYPISFGPACWITSRLGQGASLLPTIYHPLLAVMRVGQEEKERQFCIAYSWMVGRPERVPHVPDGGLSRFARLGAVTGWHWRYDAIYTIRSVPAGDARIRLGDEAWEWSEKP